MKRRNPNDERARWSTLALFQRGRRLRRIRTLLNALVLGALGAASVLVIGVLMFGRAEAGSFTTKASWYDEGAGSPTAYGEIYDPAGLTAAHRTLPYNTRLRVCRTDGPTGCVTVRVNDFGPAKWTGRGIDLSLGAALALNMVEDGVVPVRVEVLGVWAVGDWRWLRGARP